jgi:N-acetylglucosamine-6-phosphate deacetylase
MNQAYRGNLLLGSDLTPGVVVVNDGVIVDIMRGDHASMSRDHVVDYDIISPGLIDLQVNGALGLEVSHSPDAIHQIAEWSLHSGVTGWLPTIVTAPASAYPRVFDLWRGVDRTRGATPLGLHLEGPFLTVARKGAHNPEWITAADDDLFDSWLQQEGITLVTLAADRPGVRQRIRALAERGILVSLGHTDASYEEFEAGIDAGARKATHLFNAMSAIHHREPGAMVATMLDDRVTAGLIADGIHCHPAMLRLAFRTMGAHRIALVSDMMSACGNGPGTYHLGGRDVIVSDTMATLADGTLAGSIMTMDQAVRNMVAWTDATPAEALAMACTVPARLIGATDRGELRVGARADLACWTSDLQVVHTRMADGQYWTA